MTKSRTKLNMGFIVLLYFMLKPLYIGESGDLQIADVFLLLMVAVFLGQQHLVIRMRSDSRQLIVLFGWLILYQLLDNLIWSGITGDLLMNRRTLYYVFNFIAFSFTIVIGDRIGTEELLHYLGLGCFWSAVVVLVGLVTATSSSVRSVGFFNNPNQLGYFGVVVLSGTILCHRQMSAPQRLLIFGVSFWAVVASLSKAAILGYIGLVFLYILFFQARRTLKRVILQILLFALLALAIYLLLFSESRIVTSNRTLLVMRERILYMSEENDTNLRNGRGYGRILEMGYNHLWGMGEGAYDRFVSRHDTEVHSTYASLLVSYGLIGLIWYGVILFKCLGRPSQWGRSIPTMSGILLYSITHNGVRNTLVWMLMAVLYLVNRAEREKATAGLEPDRSPLLDRSPIDGPDLFGSL